MKFVNDGNLVSIFRDDGSDTGILVASIDASTKSLTEQPNESLSIGEQEEIAAWIAANSDTKVTPDVKVTLGKAIRQVQRVTRLVRSVDRDSHSDLIARIKKASSDLVAALDATTTDAAPDESGAADEAGTMTGLRATEAPAPASKPTTRYTKKR